MILYPKARVPMGGTRNVEIADPSTHSRGFVLAGGRTDTCPAARTEERLYRLDLYWRGAPGTDGQFQTGSKQTDCCSGTGARYFDVRVELSFGPKARYSSAVNPARECADSARSAAPLPRSRRRQAMRRGIIAGRRRIDWDPMAGHCGIECMPTMKSRTPGVIAAEHQQQPSQARGNRHTHAYLLPAPNKEAPPLRDGAIGVYSATTRALAR